MYLLVRREKLRTGAIIIRDEMEGRMMMGPCEDDPDLQWFRVTRDNIGQRLDREPMLSSPQTPRLDSPREGILWDRARETRGARNLSSERRDNT